MGGSCGVKCAKGILVTFNLCFWVSGCGLLAMGVYLLVDKEKSTLFHFFTVPGMSYTLSQYLAWALVGIGAIVFTVGFCGCCGAVRESRPLLVTYFLFLFLIMGAELAVGILSVIFQDKMLVVLDDLAVTLKEEYGISGPTTEAFDYAQTRFNCCGIFGPEDYVDSAWKIKDLGKGDQVSKTCCVLVNGDHMDPKPLNSSWCQSAKPMENVLFRHQEGCITKLEEFVKKISILLVAIGCGVASLEVKYCQTGHEESWTWFSQKLFSDHYREETIQAKRTGGASGCGKTPSRGTEWDVGRDPVRKYVKIGDTAALTVRYQTQPNTWDYENVGHSATNV